jgi:voltage-gated potassium channel
MDPRHLRTPEKPKLLKRAGDWVRGHLVTSTVAALFGFWFAISWLVYFHERDVKDATITSYGKALWWGIVTFLTVGYGDYVPITAWGRVWAGVLMFAGVIGVAIITSRFSSYFLEQALREGRGLVNTDSLKNHFIVCGWKEDMEGLLTHILDFNPGMASHDLIVVANLQQTIVDGLRGNPRLKELQFVIGQPFEATNLLRAAPSRARKVLILADRSPGANGAVPTQTEVDARTIMTAMSLSNIARGTMVAAEILDVKMDQYLKLAGVSEVIYSREYSRLLLANASGGTGVTNIIFDLLDTRTPTRITTYPIADHWHEKRYDDLKLGFERENPGCAIIGILENTGNTHTIKEMALRQAQKTPDMSRLVKNLKSVKELRCNHPVFSPSPDYVVHEGAMAIVIETRAAVTAEKGDKDAGPQARAA